MTHVIAEPRSDVPDRARAGEAESLPAAPQPLVPMCAAADPGPLGAHRPSRT